MGQVWRAEDTTLHRIVAAKILRSEFTGDDTFIARFRAEARNTAALSHPNIASIFDYGETVHESERLAYLVMELVEGEPLVETLIRERRLSPERTLDILEQTAMGLAPGTARGRCTAISSRATSSSGATAYSKSPTSASRVRLTASR